MAQSDLSKLFEKFVRNDLNAGEVRRFSDMFYDAANRDEIDALLQNYFVNSAHSWSNPDNLDELFDSLMKRAALADSPVTPYPPKVIPLYRRSWIPALVAAAVLIVIGLSALLYFGRNQRPASNEMVFTAQKGERKNITLPDGSKVQINAGSTLTLASGFNTTSRLITLSGEAYFDVTKNKNMPFTIHTNSMDVKVLGTTLNIRAYPEEATDEAALIDGKVLVTLSNENANHGIRDYYLSPLQKIVVSKEKPGSVPIEAPGAAGQVHQSLKIDTLRIFSLIDQIPETAWTENMLFFNADPVSEVKNKIEKWYGVTVRIDNKEIENLHFTGSYRNLHISEVMEALHIANPGLNYKIENNEKLIILY